MNRAALLIALAAAAPLSARAAEYKVSSPADVAKVSPDLKPGDTVILADGTWTDQNLAINASGTADQPITFRAENPGKFLMTGTLTVTIEGQYVVVSGLYVKGAKAAVEDKGEGVAIKGSHCRLTESAFEGDTHEFFVHLIGTDNRVDHCYIAEKTSAEPTFQIEVPFDRPDNDVVDHNHFGHRQLLGGNGGETMRVGYSWQSMNVSKALVESNLFDRCDGEIEIISSKSCDNIYRYNTFLDCAGMLTLRHGNRCVIDSNFFIAHHKRGSGGIRVIGEDHTIVNNYIDGVYQGAFWITAGVINSKLIQYIEARRTTIAFNTVVDSTGPIFDLAAGYPGRKLLPDQLTIANNLLSVGKGGALFKNGDHEGTNNTWLNNLIAPGDGVAEHAGIKAVDLKLEKGSDGLMHPAKDSPAIGAAVTVPTQSDIALAPTYILAARTPADIDGQPRPKDKRDVGCDQLSDAPVKNRPLTAGDVGPSWLPRTAGEPTDAAK